MKITLISFSSKYHSENSAGRKGKRNSKFKSPSNILLVSDLIKLFSKISKITKIFVNRNQRDEMTSLMNYCHAEYVLHVQQLTSSQDRGLLRVMAA